MIPRLKCGLAAKHFTRKPVYSKMNAMVRSIILVCLCISAFAAFGSGQEASPTPHKANSRPTPTPEPPPAEPFDKADVKTLAAQCVELDTEKGLIDIELYPEMAPETVRNFLNLVAIGAYDTTTFSRVVPGFVIQGGNLATRETATLALAKRAQRTIPDEPNRVLHERGVLSMARSDEPNSASTHFFILVNAAPLLDGRFAAFGRVTKGMDVVDVINRVPVIDEKPEKPVRLKKASVITCASTPVPN